MLDVSASEEVITEVIDIPERYRAMDESKVGALADSMAEIGLMSPIHVRSVNDGEFVVLVAGRHRLEAARRLGWETVKVCFVDGDDDEFRLWEIAENLHRSELTPLERSEHIAEWLRITEKKLGQLDPVSKGGRGLAGGVRAASREINIDRNEARRANKIDGITAEAKAAAREAGLDTNQSALLKVATTPKEEQVAAVERIRAERAHKKPEPSSGSINDIDATVEALAYLLGEKFEEVAQQICRLDLGRFRDALLVRLTN